jgi:hypothetical protein
VRARTSIGRGARPVQGTFLGELIADKQTGLGTRSFAPQAKYMTCPARGNGGALRRLRRPVSRPVPLECLGYATITMWSADIGDWRLENETTLIANAQKSFQPQQIVIGHANLPTVTHCYAFGGAGGLVVAGWGRGSDRGAVRPWWL